MVWTNKVVWQEGMFLRTQHFQQQDRHFAHNLQARAAPLQSYPWGLVELSIDRNLLNAGRFAVSRATGVFEDGTSFEFEGADAPMPLELSPGTRGEIVYLALPLHQDGNPEVADSGQSAEISRARFELRSFLAHDTHSGSNSTADLGVARLRLRYMLQSDERAGYTCVGLARIVDVPADAKVQLDDGYIPPCLKVSASIVLSSLLPELSGLLGQRAEGLAARISPGAQGLAQIKDFLFLQLVNRWRPLLAHWSHSGDLHPESMFAALVALAGELATFTASERRAVVYPAYKHDDLQRSFAPVIADLRRAFAATSQTDAVSIQLQKPDSNNIRRGPVLDRTLLTSRRFILVVSADVPGEVIRRFPKFAIIGAVENIVKLAYEKLPV